MQIAQNTVASIDYTLKDDEGQVLDSSEGGDALAYLHGAGNIIPGLEEALEGKAVGDAVEVRVPPEKGYGTRDDAMVQTVQKSVLPSDSELELGMQFQARSEQGVHVVTVVGIEDDEVRLDANHPLAGMTLHFQVEVKEVRAATAEELEHGHVHGAGGHAH